MQQFSRQRDNAFRPTHFCLLPTLFDTQGLTFLGFYGLVFLHVTETPTHCRSCNAKHYEVPNIHWRLIFFFSKQIIFFSQKQSLARIKAFYTVPMTVYTLDIPFLCSKRLCVGICPNLRDDDSCDSTLAIYQELFIYLIRQHALTSTMP